MKFLNPKIYANPSLIGCLLVFLTLFQPKIAQAMFFNTPVSTKINYQNQPVEVILSSLSESLDQAGVYSATYQFKSRQKLEFNALIDESRCDFSSLENKKPQFDYCPDPEKVSRLHSIDLNAYNLYTQKVTILIVQKEGVKCGSFQTDLYLNGQKIAGTYFLANKTSQVCPALPILTQTTQPLDFLTHQSLSLTPANHPIPALAVMTISALVSGGLKLKKLQNQGIEQTPNLIWKRRQLSYKYSLSL